MKMKSRQMFKTMSETKPWSKNWLWLKVENNFNQIRKPQNNSDQSAFHLSEHGRATHRVHGCAGWKLNQVHGASLRQSDARSRHALKKTAFTKTSKWHRFIFALFTSSGAWQLQHFVLGFFHQQVLLSRFLGESSGATWPVLTGILSTNSQVVCSSWFSGKSK